VISATSLSSQHLQRPLLLPRCRSRAIAPISTELARIAMSECEQVWNESYL
jgi:hypothetical protein